MKQVTLETQINKKETYYTSTARRTSVTPKQKQTTNTRRPTSIKYQQQKGGGNLPRFTAGEQKKYTLLRSGGARNRSPQTSQ